MKRSLLFGWLVSTALALPFAALSQTDDLRQATGLPIPIGAPAIYGQVKLKGFNGSEPKPSINVSLYLSGAQVDRMQTNDKGFYYFLRSPQDGATLIFEINNNEIGRIVLSAGIGSSVRRDIEIDWNLIQPTMKDVPGVISAKGLYARSGENNKSFDKAMAARREKHFDLAISLFLAIIEKDPNDFVSLTELGTLYFQSGKHAEAESTYAKALKLKPDFMVALVNLGKLYLTLKQPEKAIPVFLTAARLDQSSPDLFHYLGESYLQAKQGSKAVIAFNEAIRLAPIEKAALHLRLALLYNAAGAKEQAAQQYKIYLEKMPNYADRERLKKYIKENSK